MDRNCFLNKGLLSLRVDYFELEAGDIKTNINCFLVAFLVQECSFNDEIKKLP